MEQQRDCLTAVVVQTRSRGGPDSLSKGNNCVEECRNFQPCASVQRALQADDFSDMPAAISGKEICSAGIFGGEGTWHLALFVSVHSWTFKIISPGSMALQGAAFQSLRHAVQQK